MSNQFILLQIITPNGLLLYKFIVKKTSAEKVPVDQIKGLDERIFMGRKKYFLELKNGKKRDLLEVK